MWLWEASVLKGRSCHADSYHAEELCVLLAWWTNSHIIFAFFGGVFCLFGWLLLFCFFALIAAYSIGPHLLSKMSVCQFFQHTDWAKIMVTTCMSKSSGVTGTLFHYLSEESLRCNSLCLSKATAWSKTWSGRKGVYCHTPRQAYSYFTFHRNGGIINSWLLYHKYA